VRCLAWWGTVRRSTIKILHHWWRIIWREVVLLVYLNAFSEEINEAHSDKSLKNLSFLRRQCAVLSPAGCSPAEYHKKFISWWGNIYQGISLWVLKYFFRGNQWSSFWQIIKIFRGNVWCLLPPSVMKKFHLASKERCVCRGIIILLVWLNLFVEETCRAHSNRSF